MFSRLVIEDSISELTASVFVNIWAYLDDKQTTKGGSDRKQSLGRRGDMLLRAQ